MQFTLTSTQKEWLTNSDSLTQRLRNLTHHQITHHLFYDHWGAATDTLRTSLQLKSKTKTWIRQMEWHFHEEIWLACTVVIPETSIQKDTEILRHVGTKSIGDILFQDKTLKRDPFTFQEWQDEKGNPYWTRRSIFYFKQKPLLIEETFFHAFFRKIACEIK